MGDRCRDVSFLCFLVGVLLQSDFTGFRYLESALVRCESGADSDCLLRRCRILFAAVIAAIVLIAIFCLLFGFLFRCRSGFRIVNYLIYRFTKLFFDLLFNLLLLFIC